MEKYILDTLKKYPKKRGNIKIKNTYLHKFLQTKDNKN